MGETNSVWRGICNRAKVKSGLGGSWRIPVLVATLETPPPGCPRPTKILLSVVVPCFNAEDVLSLTYHRLIEVMGTRDFRLQIVFVNDGSDARTSEIITSFSKDDVSTI
jgi:hypothetical protein